MDSEQHLQVEYLISRDKVESLDPLSYRICRYFSDRLPKWHQLKPNALVLTAHSATVYQPLIKRAWLKTYNRENAPEILNIDPHILKYGLKAAKPIFPPEKFNASSRVLVFDEISSLYNDTGTPQKYISEGPKYGKENNSLDKVAQYLQGLGIEDVWIDTSREVLWGAGHNALLQRGSTEQGEVLERRRDKADINVALDYAKKMRALGELVSELIKNKVEVK